MSLCDYCGEESSVQIAEIWTDHNFSLATCCDARHDEIVCLLNDDPDAAASLLRGLDVEALAGAELRRVASDDAGASLLLDYQLRITPVSFSTARSFVGNHHTHNKPPVGWRFGAGVRNGSTLIGVVMVGRPVARLIDHHTTVEVNRLCIRRDTPSALAWNACSMLYGWAAREAKRRRFLRIITYTLQSEAGTTLRAAGWSLDGESRGGRWSCPSRLRPDDGPQGPKRRWARDLRRA